jgi:hypothetical protein
MPRRKKRADELTNEEVMQRLFPKRVVTKVKEEAEKSSKKATKRDDKD